MKNNVADNNSKGWWVVLGAAVGMGCSNIPVSLFSFSVFIQPLSEEFGWSRAEVTAAATCQVIGSILIVPAIGALIDRRGARKFILLCFVLFAVSVAQLSLLNGSLLHLYASFFLIALAASGISPAAFCKVVTSWFRQKRGLALGLTMAGSSLGTAVSPILATQVLTSEGWRAAFVALAGMPLLIGLPFAYLFIQNRPSDHTSLSPERRDSTTQEHSVPPLTELAIPLSSAWRTNTFWKLAVGIVLIAIGYSSTALQLGAVLDDRGIDKSTAGTVLALVGISSMFGRVLSGYLLDRIHAKIIAVGSILAAGMAVTILLGDMPVATMFAGAILLGLSTGAEVDVMAYIVSRYFGSAYLASIFGVMTSFYSVGVAVGPLTTAFLFDHFGSYDIARTILVVLLAVAALLFVSLGKYPNPQNRTS